MHVQVSHICMIFVFFFKQKTAYEMRISDWSSDVCSSDLDHPANAACNGRGTVTMSRNIDLNAVLSELGPRFAAGAAAHDADDSFVTENYQIGRASCRERVCQYV